MSETHLGAWGDRPWVRLRTWRPRPPRTSRPRRERWRPPPRARPPEGPSSRAPAPALILIGGRGCGKSALCRRLVAADGRFTLYSLDDMIVEEAGMSIPDIVDTRGWAWFRDLEYDVCVKAAKLAREDASGWTLIDAGGGVVVDLDENGNETYSQRKVRRRRDPYSRAAFVASPPRPIFARGVRRVVAATHIRARRSSRRRRDPYSRAAFVSSPPRPIFARGARTRRSRPGRPPRRRMVRFDIHRRSSRRRRDPYSRAPP